MPNSDAQGKHIALEWYRKIAPKTVVDVGAGCGTYATLMRTDPDTESSRDWTAIEAWQPYVRQYRLRALYNRVFVADCRDLGPSVYEADLVIFGDVLEHMTRAEAVKVLTTAQTHAANIIVSIPVLHLDQDAVGGNPYERHVDHWTFGDMRAQLTPGLVKTWWGDVLAYYWWSAEAARKQADWLARANPTMGHPVDWEVAREHMRH